MENYYSLWFLNLDEVSSNLNLRAEELLSSEEASSTRKFRFETDRMRAIWSRIFPKLAISDLFNTDFSEISFTVDPLGKRELLCRNQKIKSNISHTRKTLLLAISPSCPIGVDIEAVELREEAVKIAKNYFAESEHNFVQMQVGPRKELAFTQLWTLKESYLKACGVGLTRSPRGCVFELNSGGEDLYIPRLIEWPSDLYYGEVVSGIHRNEVFSVCMLGKKEGKEVNFEILEVRPISSEGTLSLRCKRLNYSLMFRRDGGNELEDIR